MITAAHWQAIDFTRFESLALAHVQTVYPNAKWKPTRLVKDGGRDAVGTVRDVATGVEEIYWMEAKHHPRKRSIGPYTLDTHLISVVSAGGVKRLHVVTSGRLSGDFIVRAGRFASDHGFVFSFSDAPTLCEWLRLNPSNLEFFGSEAKSVKDALFSRVRRRTDGSAFPILASSFILPENDAPVAPASGVEHLLPGRKYLLVLAFTTASASPPPVRVRWVPDPQHASVLLRDIATEGIVVQDITATPVVVVPFRMLRYGRSPIVNPTIEAGEHRSTIPLRPPRVLPRLVSPFVGETAERLLAEYKRLLVQDVLESRPRLMAFVGRAGSGKSRLAEELRDDAQRLGCTVRMVRFAASADVQQETWRTLFRWLFGLEHNLFDFDERELLLQSLQRLADGADVGPLAASLSSFLVDGKYDEELFSRDLVVGRHLADIAARRLRGPEPLLLHIDDAHHLSARQMEPLFFLRHIVETRPSLPLCVLVTSRDDETVVERAIDHFVKSIDVSDTARLTVERLDDFSPPDARELLAKTLEWPELQLPDSDVAGRIIERAGLNPFSLIQTVEHIAVDRQAVAFGHGSSGLLVDVTAFKQALSETPRGVDRILKNRFEGLLRLDDGADLFEILGASALLGREAELRVISAAIGRRVTLQHLESLLTLGYLHSATETHLLMSHDLLVEALLREPVSTRVAERYAQKLPRSRALGDLDDQRRASIYYYAGNRYADQSWNAIVRVIHHADETEDYRRVLDVLQLIEKLKTRSPAVVSLDHQLAYIIAGSYQHCGNTKVALDRFSALVEQARSQLGVQPCAAKEFAECAVEVANQSYLRADVLSGLRYIRQTLDVLEDAEYDFGSEARTSLLCLTRNRRGALLHLSGQDVDAEEEYRRALALAQEVGDIYLECHTYTDLATILRFRDLNACAAMIDASRRISVDRLANKVRRRLMIDCASRYTDCLQRNTYSTRGKLLGVATEAIEKGFLFQAADAFLCQAYSAVMQGEWSEARQAAVRALNVTASSDDLRARLHAYHYLSVAEAGLNNIERVLDAQMEARRLSARLGFQDAPLLLALAANQNAIEDGRLSEVAPTPFALV